MKMIRRSGPYRTRTVPRGGPIGYGGKGATPPPPGVFYQFDGLSMNATMATNWLPTTPAFNIRVTTVFKFVQPGDQWLVSNGGSSQGLVARATTNLFTGRINTGAVVNMTSPVEAQVDTVYELHLRCAVGDNAMVVNGQSSPVTPGTSSITLPVNRLGGSTTTNGLTGYMGFLELEDVASPANTVYFPMNEGAGDTFFAYEADRVTPKPAFNATIIGFNALSWQVITA